MATTIDEGFVKQYSDYFELALQKQDSKLQQACTMAGGYTGEKVQPVKRVGSFEFQPRVSRLQPTINVEPAYYARALAPQPYQVAPIFDRTDAMFLGFSPESSLAESGRAAANRLKDNVLAGAFLTPALTGKDGLSSTPFDTTNMLVPIGTGGNNTGINYDKWVAALEILGRMRALDSGEMPFILISFKQHSRLLKQLEVIDQKYKIKANIDERGRVASMLGVTIIVDDFDALYSAGTNTRKCPMWVKSGMHIGMWDDVKVMIEDRADISYARQIFHEIVLGGTRLDERRVVEIDCFE